MNWALKEYQQKAVDEVSTGILSLLEHEGRGEICVLRAPTGSGKTLMMAHAIKEVMRLSEEDICFLWMTIGKGDLHIQSKKSLETFFNGAPRVSLIDQEFGGSRNIISRNEVVVANWQKLYSKDGKTGEWKNVLMKDGENVSFLEVLEKTRKKRNLILIIDESHVGAGAERTTELRKIIDADVVVEVSATPKSQVTPSEISRHSAVWVEIDPINVIREGMIKKEIIINDRLGKITNKTSNSQELVLATAIERRIELVAAYRSEGSDVNPLVMIQVPTSDAGDDIIKFTKGFLAQNDITEKNGKLAFWLSEKNTAPETLKHNDDATEFLIFKQAIDTGWDCPRAQILVKYRKPGKEVFEIQTVGRILRMPEQCHYENELLNKGYVFTNQLDFSIHHEEYNPNIIVTTPAHRVPSYKNISLKSFFVSRADYADVKANFTPVFSETADKILRLKKTAKENLALVSKQLVFDLNRFQQEILVDTKLETENFDRLSGRIDPAATLKLEKAADEVLSDFESFIQSRLGPFTNVSRSVPNVKSAIYLWFRNSFDTEKWNEEMLMIQKAVLHPKNIKIFDQILHESIERYKVIKHDEVHKRMQESEKWESYEIPSMLYVNESMEEVLPAKKYAYDICSLDINRSRPEKEFEKFIELQPIHWWWKNGEASKEYFGIRYELEDGVHTFYPDYLVQFLDGRLGIFEVKDEHDRDGHTATKAKHEALQNYISGSKNKNIIGGIVIKRENTWYLNERPVYNWTKVEKGNWEDWVSI